MLKRILNKLYPSTLPAYGLHEYREANRLISQPPALVVIGDSIVAGWFRAGELFKRPGVVNRGIGGQTSAQVLVRFRQDVIALRPQSVLILVGTNDIAEGREVIDIANNIASCCDLAAYHGIRPLIASILPVRPEAESIRPLAKITALNKRVHDYAEHRDYLFLDFHSALTDTTCHLVPSFARDPVHLSAAGYHRLESLFLPSLIP